MSDEIRARLLANLDALYDLVRDHDEPWANWLHTCRALIGRGDDRGLDRFLEGATESGGLADLELGPHAERFVELVGACHDDAAALRQAG